MIFTRNFEEIILMEMTDAYWMNAALYHWEVSSKNNLLY